MRPGVRGLAAMGAVLGVCLLGHAGTLSADEARPAASSLSDPASASPPVTAAGEPVQGPPLTPPALHVAGMIVTSRVRLGFVVPMDETRQQGGVLKVQEGDLVQGYRVAAIDERGVVFEKDGRRVLVRLGRPGEPGDAASTPPAPGTSTAVKASPLSLVPTGRPPTMMFLPELDEDRPPGVPAPPENVEELREQARQKLEPIFSQPVFQQQVERVRERLLQRQLQGGEPAPPAESVERPPSQPVPGSSAQMPSPAPFGPMKLPGK